MTFNRLRQLWVFSCCGGYIARSGEIAPVRPACCSLCWFLAKNCGTVEKKSNRNVSSRLYFQGKSLPNHAEKCLKIAMLKHAGCFKRRRIGWRHCVVVYLSSLVWSEQLPTLFVFIWDFLLSRRPFHWLRIVFSPNPAPVFDPSSSFCFKGRFVIPAISLD